MNKQGNSANRTGGRRSATRLIFTALALFLVSQASAGVVVVVSPDVNVDKLSRSQVKAIFLGKVKSLPDGQKALPVNQSEKSPVYDAFNEKVLGRPSAKVLQYWAARVFSGKGYPPETVPDDKSVIEYVKSHKGAIGYVDSGTDTGGVKAVLSVD